MANRKWLKKYTRLEYLEDILTENRLFLGDPEKWSDRNDAYCLKRYAELEQLSSLRVTCLTSSSDRFHFWSIFGSERSGVCLWFDQEELKSSIKKDSSLVGRRVRYVTAKKARSFAMKDLPYLKRSQYSDEREFRVVSSVSKKASSNTSSEYFEFDPTSLRRIYLNAWLDNRCVKAWRDRIADWAPAARISVKQSRMIDSGSWQKAIDCINRPTP